MGAFDFELVFYTVDSSGLPLFGRHEPFSKELSLDFSLCFMHKRPVREFWFAKDELPPSEEKRYLTQEDIKNLRKNLSSAQETDEIALQAWGEMWNTIHRMYDMDNGETRSRSFRGSNRGASSSRTVLSLPQLYSESLARFLFVRDHNSQNFSRIQKPLVR
jgi:hypothetical protein